MLKIIGFPTFKKNCTHLDKCETDQCNHKKHGHYDRHCDEKGCPVWRKLQNKFRTNLTATRGRQW